jgi:hypothetical protein
LCEKKTLEKMKISIKCFFIVALKDFVNNIIEGENITAAYTSIP